jgi:hypothetical protein
MPSLNMCDVNAQQIAQLVAGSGTSDRAYDSLRDLNESTEVAPTTLTVHT